MPKDRAPKARTITFEDTRILFPNFSGRPGAYNREGDRGFSVLVPPSEVDTLLAQGWNVKQLNSREEGEPGDFVLHVKVNFSNRPPRITIIGEISQKRTIVTEEMVNTLDYIDVVKVDVIVRAYDWEVRGEHGTSAYLQTMFLIFEEDELQLKYAEGVPND